MGVFFLFFRQLLEPLCLAMAVPENIDLGNKLNRLPSEISSSGCAYTWLGNTALGQLSTGHSLLCCIYLFTVYIVFAPRTTPA